MTSAELEIAQDALGLGPSDMARALNTPLRTYQDWLAGVNRIPGVVEVAVTLLTERVNWSMEKVKVNIDARIRADFPSGIRGGFND